MKSIYWICYQAWWESSKNNFNKINKLISKIFFFFQFTFWTVIQSHITFICTLNFIPALLATESLLPKTMPPSSLPLLKLILLPAAPLTTPRCMLSVDKSDGWASQMIVSAGSPRKMVSLQGKFNRLTHGTSIVYLLGRVFRFLYLRVPPYYLFLFFIQGEENFQSNTGIGKLL